MKLATFELIRDKIFVFFLEDDFLNLTFVRNFDILKGFGEWRSVGDFDFVFFTNKLA